MSAGCITLAQAERIVDAGLAHARELGLPPMTVAVLDSAGRLVALKSQDNSSLLRPEIAHAKAYGSLAMGMGSRGLEKRAETHPSFVQSITALAGGQLVPVPGGVLIYEDDTLLGAIGVSGALPDQDEACGLAGIAAAGLVGETDNRRH